MPPHLGVRFRVLTTAVALVVLTPVVSRGQGIVLPGVGPINAGFGGAGTAAPLDATGALYWNPAAISALEDRVDIGVELLSSRNTVSSRVAAGVFGMGSPAASGSTRNDSGMAPLPAIGAITRPEGSPFTYGISLLTIGGFFVNFPASTTNPVFTAPPKGGGLGSVYSRLSILQIAPTVAADLGNGWSVGAAPTINVADLQLSAAPFSALNFANGVPFYPQAFQGRLRYGLGFQVGVYYQSERDLNFGFSFKSPQWFEQFSWNSTNESASPQTFRTNLTYPMILSWGVSYTGIEKLIVATDLRYIGYSSASGFGGSPAFRKDGSIAGLGWHDVFALGVGAQYQLTDRFTARAGYTYNQNPIPAATTFLNVAAPGVFQHGLDLGVTYKLTDRVSLSAAWVHAFSASISGPFVYPTGPVPGTQVRAEQQTDSAIAGLTFNY